MSAKPVTNIAIVGSTGHVGKYFTEAILKNGQHSIKALVRPESASKVPQGVTAVKINYDDEASIVEALKGIQFLIITLSVNVPDEVHTRITTAAGKAGVPYVMPNVYGYPIDPINIDPEDIYGNMSVGRLRDVTNNGVSSYVALSCGFWYEWSLSMADGFGFDIENRKVTFFDDGKRAITVSSWDQCGRGIVKLLSLPESGAQGTSLSDFKNKSACIYSFSVSQRDMLDSLHRVLGTTDKDWAITYEPLAERVKAATKKMQEGDRSAFGRFLYGAVFMNPSEAYNFAATSQADNEALGLAAEDLDEATRRTVDMVKKGSITRYGEALDEATKKAAETV